MNQLFFIRDGDHVHNHSLRRNHSPIHILLVHGSLDKQHFRHFPIILRQDIHTHDNVGILLLY
ncbi:MAG: hypothetical protein K0R69_3482, partial [Clostridia bacterium]|nr:hypothetical protein [Clostridia bacterium]